MRVYIVLLLDYEGSDIEGVYGSKDAAEKKAAELKAAEPLGYWSVATWEVDGQEIKDEAAA